MSNRSVGAAATRINAARADDVPKPGQGAEAAADAAETLVAHANDKPRKIAVERQNASPENLSSAASRTSDLR